MTRLLCVSFVAVLLISCGRRAPVAVPARQPVTNNNETPRARVARAATEHVVAINEWVREFNAIPPGALSAREDAAWAPLEELFRRFRQARTAWIRGDIR